MSDVHSILSKKLLRINQVLALVPIGRSSWWKGCKDGRYPQPVKLGLRTTAWRAEDIVAFIDSLGNQGGGK
jgi:predicted DNA-binding transcriptional regulator AlpA